MQTRSIETRAKIVQAAQDLFSKTGYESSSVSDICDRAGISKGAFYHHFPSKQAVFMELLSEWLKGIDIGLEAMRNSQTGASQPLVRMADIIPSVIHAAEGRLPIFLEFLVHSARDQELWKTAIAPYQRYREFFQKIVDEMDPEGAIDPAKKETAAIAVMSLAIGLLLQGVVEPRATDWGAAGRESIQMLLEGMTRRSS